MNYHGQTFTNERIDLDGNSFKDCRFVKCRIVYSGGPVIIDGASSFDAECVWILAGPARRTVDLFTQLYHGFGPGGRKMMEDTFNDIRIGRHFLAKKDPPPDGA